MAAIKLDDRAEASASVRRKHVVNKKGSPGGLPSLMPRTIAP